MKAGGEPATGAGDTGSDEASKTTDDPVGESAAVPAGPNYMSGGSCGCRIEAGRAVDVSPLAGWLAVVLAMVSPLAVARLAAAKSGRR